MDLGSFLADDSLGGGSWADEEVDLTSIGVNTTAAVPERPTGEFSRQNFGAGSGSSDFQRERREFPIPENPPYRARINNLPWDINENDVVEFFEKRMQMNDIITDVALPVDHATGKLRGFGFVTFTERGILEEALRLSLSDFNGRRVFVNVAAPPKDSFDLDWRGARDEQGLGGNGRRPRREEPDLDWGAARSEQVGLPPRERSDRGPPRPRREEPDLDWGAARSEQVGLPPRERTERTSRPRREEPDLDWGSARTEKASLPPRERSTRKPRKQEPELDWGSARSEHAAPAPRSRNTSNRFNKTEEKKEDGPQKSVFNVLSIEGESDEEQEKKEVKKSDPLDLSDLKQNVPEVSKSTPAETEDGWEVVRK